MTEETIPASMEGLTHQQIAGFSDGFFTLMAETLIGNYGPDRTDAVMSGLSVCYARLIAQHMFLAQAPMANPDLTVRDILSVGIKAINMGAENVIAERKAKT